MNKIYRLVWNTTLEAWVAVSELSKSLGKSARARGALKKLSKAVSWLTLGAMMTVTSNSVYAACTTVGAVTTCMRDIVLNDVDSPIDPSNPTHFLNGNAIFTDGVGDGSINGPSANSMEVNTTGNVILNWEKLNVLSGQTANFNQDGDPVNSFLPPTSDSTILNQISDDATTIAGTVNSNGNVAFINPNGITIEGTATIDVGGFVASGLNLASGTSIPGGLSFSGGEGAVSNVGTITIKNENSVLALVGKTVDNTGILTATKDNSRIMLAAGTEVKGVGNNSMATTVTATKDNTVKNDGNINNSNLDGSAVLYGGQASNNEEIIVGQNGVINLAAGNSITESEGPRPGLTVNAGDSGNTVINNSHLGTGDDGVVRMYGYTSTNEGAVTAGGTEGGGVVNVAAGTTIVDSDKGKTLSVTATDANEAKNNSTITADKGQISVIGGVATNDETLTASEGKVNLLAGNKASVEGDDAKVEEATKDNVATNSSEITADKGKVAIIGGNTKNEGTVQADGGKVNLLAGNKASVEGGKASTEFTGDSADIVDYAVTNTGSIQADKLDDQAGTIVVAGPTVNNDGGQIKADGGDGSVQVGAGGKVTGGDNGLEVTNADDTRYDISNDDDGSISANDGGGSVELSSNGVQQNANVTASGGSGGNIDIHGVNEVFFSDSSMTDSQGDGDNGSGELNVTVDNEDGSFTADGELSTDNLNVAADNVSYGGEKPLDVTNSATFTHSTDSDTLHVTKGNTGKGISEETINAVGGENNGDHVVDVTLKGDKEITGDDAGIDLVSKGDLSLEAGEGGITGNPLKLTADKDVNITSQGDAIAGPIKASNDVNVDVTEGSFSTEESIEADHDVNINVNDDFTGTTIDAGNNLNVDKVGGKFTAESTESGMDTQVTAGSVDVKDSMKATGGTMGVTATDGDISVPTVTGKGNVTLNAEKGSIKPVKEVTSEEGDVTLLAQNDIEVDKATSEQGALMADAGKNLTIDQAKGQQDVTLTAGEKLNVKEVTSEDGKVTADAGQELNVDKATGKGDVTLTSGGKNTTKEVTSEEGNVTLESKQDEVQFGMLSAEAEGKDVKINAGKDIKGDQIKAGNEVSMDSGIDNVEVKEISSKPTRENDLESLVAMVENGEAQAQNVFDEQTLPQLSQSQISRLIDKDPDGVYAVANQLSDEQVQNLTPEQLNYLDQKDGRTLREKLGLYRGWYADAQPLRVMDELDIMHREFHCPLVDGDPLELWTHYRNLGYCLYDSDIDFIEKPMVPTINVIAPPVVVEEPKPKACRRVLIDEEPKYRPAKKRKKRLVKRKRRSKKVTRARKGKRKVVRKRRRVMRAAPPAPRYKIVCD